jgi:hypothetical protein
MDPYLEHPLLWPDVHDGLIVGAAGSLQALLGARYYVDIGERTYRLEDPGGAVSDPSVQWRQASGASAGAFVTADEPIILELPTRRRETLLEIRLLGTNEVVTLIEVISPTNKTRTGRGMQEYLEKQSEALGGGLHLVEIDLLQRGRRVVEAADQLHRLPPFDYLACVSRALHRSRPEFYPFSVRDRLPRVRVPLRAPDPDVVLDLPAVFARCYDNGAFPMRVDYTQPPPETFRPDDEEWADSMLREAGLRPNPGGETGRE